MAAPTFCLAALAEAAGATASSLETQEKGGPRAHGKLPVNVILRGPRSLIKTTPGGQERLPAEVPVPD